MRPNMGFLVASAATLAMWFVSLAGLAIANRPREPDVAEETTVLGPEPPAVVNLLTQDFRVTSEAVPATLLDLAARRHVEIELVGGGKHILRLRSGRGTDLTPYEKQVLAHVSTIAVDGVVPAGALTTGPKDAARGWWKRFRDDVIRDAQRRGYSRDRWTEPMYLGLLAGLFVPAFLYAAAIHFDTDNALETLQDGVVAAATFGALAIVWVIANSPQQRDRPAGLIAAGRWLGVRAGLARNRQLAVAPPSAVAVWEGALAHAVAMGLAPAAAEGLPLGAEDDRVAWSDEGGRWRRIRVRYPRYRPAWGMKPISAIFLAAVAAIPASVLLLALSRFDAPSNYPWVGRVKGMFMIGAALVLLGAVVIAFHAAADMRETREITGTVVRMRRRSAQQSMFRDNEKHRYFVALDDGRSQVVPAFMVRREIYNWLNQGQRAKLRVTPRLRFVVDVESA